MNLFSKIRNKLHNKRVLVVGGAGFVGGAVTEILKQKGIPFVVYDLLLYEDRYMKEGGSFVYGDIRDTEKLLRIIDQHKITDIIWLAAIVGDGACAKEPENTRAINEISVQWLSENFSGRIIFISTCSVYGANENLLDESSILSPLSLYAETKINAENHLKNHPNAIILRLGTAYGISDTYARPRTDLLVNTFMAHAMKHGKINVFGGKQKRPFINVHNIAQTIAHNLFTRPTGIYNVATENYSVEEVARLVQKHTDCEVAYTKDTEGDRRDYHVSTEKAHRDGVISIDPKKTIEQTIKDFKKIIGRHRIKDVESDTYSNVKGITKTKL